MDDGKVWTVFCRMEDAMVISDMVFIDGKPFLVHEWISEAANEHPGLTIPIDPRFLQKVEPPFQTDYVYQATVDLPPGVEPPRRPDRD